MLFEEDRLYWPASVEVRRLPLMPDEAALALKVRRSQNYAAQRSSSGPRVARMAQDGSIQFVSPIGNEISGVATRFVVRENRAKERNPVGPFSKQTTTLFKLGPLGVEIGPVAIGRSAMTHRSRTVGDSCH